MALVAQGQSNGGARVALPPGADSIAIPFELLANAIFIPVLVNGKGPYLFTVDTGAYNSIVASEVAGELGIAAGAHFLTGGAGSDSSDA